MSTFWRTLCDLAGNAYTDDVVSKEILVTTIIEVLANFVVSWEVQKVKPTVVEDAVSLVLEMQRYLNLHSPQLDTSAAFVDNLTGPSTYESELFSHLNFTIEEQVK